MRFKPGQEVVCTDGVWLCAVCGIQTIGPKRNEIVIVESYYDDTFFVAAEYTEITHDCQPDGSPNCYHELSFEPLISDAELAEQLETVPMLAPLSTKD